MEYQEIEGDGYFSRGLNYGRLPPHRIRASDGGIMTTMITMPFFFTERESKGWQQFPQKRGKPKKKNLKKGEAQVSDGSVPVQQVNRSDFASLSRASTSQRNNTRGCIDWWGCVLRHLPYSIYTTIFLFCIFFFFFFFTPPAGRPPNLNEALNEPRRCMRGFLILFSFLSPPSLFVSFFLRRNVLLFGAVSSWAAGRNNSSRFRDNDALFIYWKES